jgi:hypothetical protein
VNQDLTPEQLAILDKVEKLLRLAAGNTNENEAMAASAKAQEWLNAYNLDMALVQKQSGNSAKREDKKVGGGLYKWQRELWAAVATLNHCVHWSHKGLTKGSTYEHRILGSTVNVLSTKLMAEYLQEATERLAQGWAKERNVNVFCRDAIAYREGIATRLVHRLNDRRWEQQQEARRQREEDRAKYGTFQALTILDVSEAERDANDDYLYGAGFSARWRAQEAERAAVRAKLQAEEEAWAKANPEAAAKKKAEEEAANAKYWAEWERKNKNRRVPADKGPRSDTYYSGYHDGAEISLDRQVNSTSRLALK